MQLTANLSKNNEQGDKKQTFPFRQDVRKKRRKEKYLKDC